MRRRTFILAASASVLASRGLSAKQHGVRRHIGILNYAEDDDVRIRQFREALASLGHSEGTSLTLTIRSAQGNFDRLPALASELLRANVDVIIALGPATWAARKATSTIPIVVAFSGDMVEMGVVESLARPGGNITGFSYMSGDLAAKRIELLTAAFSRYRRAGILYNPREPATKGEIAASDAAARKLNTQTVQIAVQSAEELNSAFASAKAQRVDGLVVLTHGFATIHRARIIELASHHRLPMLYGWRDFVLEGGLMSYGPDIEALVMGAAHKVDRILKGAKPSDIPVDQPTRLLLSVNLKTAKALEITLPPEVLLRADEVLE